MTFNLSSIWKKFLNDEIYSNNFLNIQIKVNNEYKNYTCFPPKVEIPWESPRILQEPLRNPSGIPP